MAEKTKKAEKSEGMLINLIIEMRVKQYLKNGLVFLPLVFSLNLYNPLLLTRIIIIFCAFCLISSAVYILNDIADRENDTRHPTKKHRPIASGKISVKGGVIIALACSAAAVGLSLYLSLSCLLVILFFAILNIMYSFLLKRVPLIDVLCIAMGFVARVAAGSFAAGVDISDWLLLTIMSLSFFLGFGKRKAEINILSENTRSVLKFYTKDFLSQCMNSMMSVSIVFYSLWTIDENTSAAMRTDKMIYSTVLVIVGLLRYSLVTEKSGEGDPTEIFINDRFLHVIIISYLVYVIALIYF